MRNFERPQGFSGATSRQLEWHCTRCTRAIWYRRLSRIELQLCPNWNQGTIMNFNRAISMSSIFGQLGFYVQKDKISWEVWTMGSTVKRDNFATEPHWSWRRDAIFASVRIDRRHAILSDQVRSPNSLLLKTLGPPSLTCIVDTFSEFFYFTFSLSLQTRWRGCREKFAAVALP